MFKACAPQGVEQAVPVITHCCNDRAADGHRDVLLGLGVTPVECSDELSCHRSGRRNSASAGS